MYEKGENDHNADCGIREHKCAYCVCVCNSQFCLNFATINLMFHDICVYAVIAENTGKNSEIFLRKHMARIKNK